MAAELVLIFIAWILASTFLNNGSKATGVIASAFALIGGICGLVAMGIFMNGINESSDETPGWAYYLGWVAGVLSLIASILSALCALLPSSAISISS